MKRVVVTGGTGLVGSLVTQLLEKAGVAVTILSRTAKRADADGKSFVQWDGQSSLPLEPVFAEADAVIHLAGENVGQRWTHSARQAIRGSRIAGGTAIRNAILALAPEQRPAVIAASAIGYYADADDWQDESSAIGDGFLAEVVEDWERALDGIETRLVTLRIGIVLSRNGGAIKRLEPLFRWGLGAPVGDGKQWQSWIHEMDLARLIVHAAFQSDMAGVYNAVAPNPVDNRDLTKAMAAAMKKPFWAPAPPAWALKLALGEMAQIALCSQRIRSIRLENTSFEFEFPEIHSAFKDLFKS